MTVLKFRARPRVVVCVPPAVPDPARKGPLKSGQTVSGWLIEWSTNHDP